MEQTKIQKKKAAEKYARERRAFLASLDEPIITVHSSQLERLMRREVAAAVELSRDIEAGHISEADTDAAARNMGLEEQ
jgi:predicted alpha/beta-hydrolase family hydrolase